MTVTLRVHQGEKIFQAHIEAYWVKGKGSGGVEIYCDEATLKQITAASNALHEVVEAA